MGERASSKVAQEKDTSDAVMTDRTQVSLSLLLRPDSCS